MRRYSAEFLRSLDDPDVEPSVGMDLARVTVRAKIPGNYVAIALAVTRMTVHKWFRGQDIRKKKRAEVKAFINRIEQDLASGRLPAKNVKEVKKYIEDLTGMPIKN